MPTDHFYYFNLAKILNKECKEVLIKHKAKFRGSLNSICLVSVNHLYTPQLNLRYPLADALRRDCSHLDQHLRNFNIIEPKRNTPEKLVQSFIIFNSMETGHLPFDENIVLITDEFAKLFNGNKLVMDLIGFNRKKNALSLIELKSKRELEALRNQLANSAKSVTNDFAFYRSFLKEHGIAWNPPFNIEKIAVWPCKDNINEKRFPQDIREICYDFIGNDIKFKEKL
jgi:hypothetical protein